MIGHTQGVKIANSPPKRPNINISHNERSVSELNDDASLNGDALSALNDEYSHTSGAVHILSSHALKRIGVRSVLARVMTNESANSSSNSRSPNSMIVMCQPGSMVAVSRTLSPISSPVHFTGCTNCAAAIIGKTANKIPNILFICCRFLVLYINLLNYQDLLDSCIYCNNRLIWWLFPFWKQPHFIKRTCMYFLIYMHSKKINFIFLRVEQLQIHGG